MYFSFSRHRIALATALAVLGGSGVASVTHAITLSNTTYTQGADIIILSRTTPPGAGEIRGVFFDVGTGAFLNIIDLPEDPGAYPISLINEIGLSDFAVFIPGNYAAVEATIGSCEENSYSGCLASPGFQNQALFSVIAAAPGTTPSGQLLHTPVIRITSPTAQKPLSGIVSITYESSDLDDALNQREHGLRDQPVSIYYSPPYSINWSLIAQNQGATGTIMWDTRKLPDHGSYRLRAIAEGKDNDLGHVLIDFIALDNTPPSFTVSAHPVFSRGEEIKILVESSEPLPEGEPRVTVAQSGREPALVPLTATGASGKTFVGTYVPVHGFDGQAKIAVIGRDFADNIGDTTLGGDVIGIGIEPPPTPLITIPGINIRIPGQELAVIQGQAKNAKTLSMRINGSAHTSVPIAADGSFRIEHIPLDPKFNAGLNVIQIIAYDQSGQSSLPARINALVNTPPTIALSSPRSGSVQSGIIPIRWIGADVNGDELVYRVEVSENEGKTWTVVAERSTTSELQWNSRDRTDGPYYVVRVTASDGIAEGSATTRRFSIRNARPVITLNAGTEAFINPQSPVLHGSIQARTDTMVGLEASLTGGRQWSPLPSDDGTWDSAFETFTIPLSQQELEAGTATVLLRGKTRDGNTVSFSQVIRIATDGEPPRVATTSASLVNRTSRPLITGVAEDDRSGIASVEYMIERSPWQRAVIERGLSGSPASFFIQPQEPLQDGWHELAIRTIDRAGNVSAVLHQTVAIDATPPRIGSFTLQQNRVLLFPTEGGMFTADSALPIRIDVAVVSSPALVKLIVGQKVVLLETLSGTPGMWSREFSVDTGDPVPVQLISIDGLGNASQRVLGQIIARPSFSPKPTTMPGTIWSKMKEFLIPAF